MRAFVASPSTFYGPGVAAPAEMPTLMLLAPSFGSRALPPLTALRLRHIPGSPYSLPHIQNMLAVTQAGAAHAYR